MITKKEARKDDYYEGYSRGCIDGYGKAVSDYTEEIKKILDRIRAEIIAKADDVDFGDKREYEEGIQFGLMLAYQIVNKAESEEV